MYLANTITYLLYVRLIRKYLGWIKVSNCWGEGIGPLLSKGEVRGPGLP